MHILVRVYGGGLFENSVSPGSESAKECCFWTQKYVLNLELDNSVEIAQIDQNPGQEASYNIVINYLFVTFELCSYWCITNFRTFDWFAQSSFL